MRRRHQGCQYLTLLVGGLLAFVVACNRLPRNDDDTCDPMGTDCEEGLVCDPVLGDEPACVLPLTIRGGVVQLIDNAPIEGALVQAVDINGAAVGTSAVTDAGGAYTLTVPAIRDDQGNPIVGIYMLRAQAAAYQEFPTAIRPALPLDAASAVASNEGGGWVIENPLTTVGLLNLPGDTSLLSAISGSINAERNTGILVVAEGAGGAFIGFSNSEGRYTIFNVPSGAYSVQGYAAGVQLDAIQVSVDPSEVVTEANLAESDRRLSTLSGNVQIVNAPGGSVTSVVLAVESTFVESVARGDVPPGLRVGNVTGAFSITGIPDGRYVALAAFENDDLVRDPDENISGTQIIHLQIPDPVAGNVITISDGFKITEALAVVSPGAEGPEAVNTSTPVLQWADDSSEDGYTIRVFDAFGNLVWEDEIEGVSGGDTVMHTYAGPPLEAGVFYQFRVWSFRAPGGGSRSAISATEDLRGVFFLPAPR